MEPLVQLQEITMSYNTKYQRVDLFSGLNLNIQKGELAVIFGPSGSGKTTLLNLIAGFVKPASGSVIIKGQNIGRFNELEVCRFRNQNIGYVFQFFNLLYSFNAADNVLVPLLLAEIEKNKAEQRVNELLKQMGMLHRSKHYPSELSGGEQQRVAIARALANSPDIILADEPTGNLDQKTGDTILDLLINIHQEGKTIIVVTHDTKIVNRATKVFEMDELLEKATL